MRAAMSTQRYARIIPAMMVALAIAWPAVAQTKVVPPRNTYSVQDDIKLGQEAASEVSKELPMLNDDGIDDYVERVGRRLVDAIPPEFRHSGFRYTFDVVNQKDINAFALPGGPMFLNRGMIESAKTEGEMAGVMGNRLGYRPDRRRDPRRRPGPGPLHRFADRCRTEDHAVRPRVRAAG
jgi:predicted Zn-dependent protease